MHAALLRRSSHRPGLTFVELLIAVAIFAMLAGGLSVHLRGAIAIWRRSHVAAEQGQRTRVLRARLSQDLANAVLVDPRPDAEPKSEWLTDRVAFGTSEPGVGAGLTSRRLTYVTYELERGAGQAASLVRRARSYRDARAGGRSKARSSVLLSDVDHFQIRYPFAKAKEPGFTLEQRPWLSPDALPRLVEVTANQRTDPEPKRANWEPLAVTTLVSLPAGTIGRDEAAPAP